MNRKLKIGARQIYQRMSKRTVPCRLCGSRGFLHISSDDRYDMGVVTVMCKKCGFLLTNPCPVPDAMQEFYRTTYRKFYSGPIDFERPYNKGSKTYARADRLYRFAKDELSKLNSANLAVLDVGCEFGVLLHIFRSNHPESRLYGIEPMPAHARVAGEKTGAAIFPEDAESFSKNRRQLIGSVNLIVLNHVLEHLYHPVEELRRLSDFLTPAGMLLVEVPNAASPYWERKPIQMLHVAHINHFNPATLKIALALAGLRVIKEQAGESMEMTYLCGKNSRQIPSVEIAWPSKEEINLCCRSARLRIRPAVRRAKQKELLKRFPNLLRAKLVASYYQQHGFFKTAKRVLERLLYEIVQRTYPAQRLLTAPVVLSRRDADRPFLEKSIQNNKVLIIGSGPSVMELKEIPDEVKIFTCNRGIKFFESRKSGRRPDLYMCTAGKMQRMAEIEDLLLKNKTDLLVIDDLQYIQKNEKFNGAYSRLIQDDGKHNDYLKTLIQPRRPKEIRGRSFHPWTSTGIRLLQYALTFGASEIYLAGIDFGNRGYFWGKNEDKWLHNDIDENFLKIVAEKYPRIYTVSRTSSASHAVPYKQLEATCPAVKTIGEMIT